MNKSDSSKFSVQYRNQLLLVSGGLISGILLSLPLWSATGTFPTFPLFEFIGQPNSTTSVGLLVALLIGLIALNIPKYTKTGIYISLPALLIILLLDQQRWQPWAYQYFLMLIPLLFLSKQKNDEGQKSTLQIHKLVLFGVYLWGAIHKFHPSFVSVFQNSLLSPITKTMQPGTMVDLVNFTAYMVPFVEVFIAIGFLFPKLRKAAVITTIGTHVFILFLLSPLVKTSLSNSVVWPWNIVMPLMAINLFWKDGFEFKQLTSKSLRPITLVIVFLVVIAPVLFYVKAWDRYLSFNLYSGKQQRVIVYFPSNSIKKLPPEWHDQLKDVDNQPRYKAISISAWAMADLNTPFVSERRNILTITKHICNKSNGVRPQFYIDYKHIPDKGNLLLQCNELYKIKDF
mgnify:CR=1 FL=1